MKDQLSFIRLQAAAAGATALQTACHEAAKDAGWWSSLTTQEPLWCDLPAGDTPAFNIAEKLCLIHSEISEAMEGHRKGLMDDKLPHRLMLEVELADAAIRIFDLAGGLGLDLGQAIGEKMAFNSTRADHQPENRRAAGGKTF